MVLSDIFDQASVTEEGISLALSCFLCFTDQFVARDLCINSLCLCNLNLFSVNWQSLFFLFFFFSPPKCCYSLKKFLFLFHEQI